MGKVISTKRSAGEYEVSNGTGRTVRVTRVKLDDGLWWVATANWDNYRYSDPLFTKRSAMDAAREMLETRGS